MNHFLLPDDGHGDGHALRLRRDGATGQRVAQERRRSRASAGQALRRGQHHVEPPDIGRRNAESALAFLRNEGIPCKSQSLGGHQARRVRFWPATGRAQQLLIERRDAVENPEIAAERPSRPAGSIELF
jgi:chemotaxis protein CheD